MYARRCYNVGALSVHVIHILQYHHQLFFDIERENIHHLQLFFDIVRENIHCSIYLCSTDRYLLRLTCITTCVVKCKQNHVCGEM